MILSIAYDLDDIETQDGGDTECSVCLQHDQRLMIINNCLRGAIAETKELDKSSTKEADESLLWLSLTYLVTKGEDHNCVESLTSGGFLDRMNRDLNIHSSHELHNDKSKVALEHVMIFAERSLEKNMPETAFRLDFLQCAPRLFCGKT